MEPASPRSGASCGDVEPMIIHPLTVADGEPVKAHLILLGSIIELLVVQKASLAARLYHPPEGWLTLYVANGPAEFSGLRYLPH